MMKLAIALMVLGVIIFANCFFILSALDVSVLIIYRKWGVWPFPLQFVLGLLVFGCGMAQFLKERG